MKEKSEFPGFPEELGGGDFWMYPVIMDRYWCELTGAEQKVLDFVLRQTYGWDKLEDKISESQFEKGIGNKNNGAGVSGKHASRCLKSLERKGFVELEGNSGKTRLIKLVINKDNRSGNKKSSTGDKNEQVKSNKSEQTINNKAIDKKSINKEAIEGIYSHFQKKINDKSRLTKKAERKINDRLKEYSVEELKEAIDIFSKKDWWMKNNSQRGVAWFFDSEDRIDQFLNLEIDKKYKKEKLWR